MIRRAFIKFKTHLYLHRRTHQKVNQNEAELDGLEDKVFKNYEPYFSN